MLECKSASASASKWMGCGFINPADGLYYRTRVKTVTEWPCSDMSHPIPDFITTDSFNEDCTSGTSVDSGNDPANHIPFGAWCRIDTVYTYSDPATPETTEAMKARAEGALSFPDDFGGSDCSSYRYLAPDESSYTIRRVKWRISHEPTPTCYLKVWLRTWYSADTSGLDAVLTPLDPYVWNGSGNPCLADPTKAVDHADNLIHGEEHDLDQPANGVMVVEIVKWSYLPDYEPPDDGSANGFPVPA